MGTVDELRKAADAGIRRSMPIDSTEQLEAALDAYDAELARLQAALTQAEAATAENLRAFCREVGKLEVELEKAEAERDAALADHTRSLLDTTFKSFQRGEVHGRAVMNADVKVLLNRLGHGLSLADTRDLDALASAPPGHVVVAREDAEKALAETRAEVVERIISAINHRVSGGGQWITPEKRIDVGELRSIIGYELAQNDESKARQLLGLDEGGTK